MFGYSRKRELREILRLRKMLHMEEYKKSKEKIKQQAILCELLTWKDYKLFREF